MGTGGEVWLRSLLSLLVIGRWDWLVGVVGLTIPAEEVSSEVVLLEYPCWYPPVRSGNSAMSLVFSWLIGDNGDPKLSTEDVGEWPLGLWRLDPRSVSSWIGLFDALRIPVDPLRTFAPRRLFFCLNFSSQAVVVTFSLPSGQPQILAKKSAFSLIISSLRGCPLLWRFFAQLDRALSISGTLPLALLMGDRLPSSGFRYFSFWRRTLETVLLHVRLNQIKNKVEIIPSLDSKQCCTLKST